MKKSTRRWNLVNPNLMASLSKLSKAFMLPISLLPIAGLFLGIGGAIVSQSHEQSTIWWLGRTMSMIGDIPFKNLPALFAISIAIAYTKNAGVAGLTALIGWLVFNAVIASLMKVENSEWKIQADFVLNWRRYPNNGSMITGVPDTAFDGYTFTMKNAGYVPPHDTVSAVADGYVGPQLGMKEALANDLSAKLGTQVLASDVTIFNPTSVQVSAQSYSLLFWRNSIAVDPSIVTPILGIGADETGAGLFGGSLNTGVFGGIVVGAIVAKLYNKFHQIELPSTLSFFGGVRFVPIITFVSMIGVAMIAIFLWPTFGILLNRLGKWTGTLSFGIDSFIFGLFKRALLPFGLHHVFYAPLWWTGAGGQLSDFVDASMVNNASTLTAQGDQSMFMAIIADGKLTIQDVWDSGLRVGRFQSGEFAMMMFALPAIGVAMWLSVPIENRRAAMGMYLGAAFTSFLTGITEPLEFTFLFVVPWVYYLIHVPIFASSYMMANLTGIRVGMTFSGGMLDWIIFGIIPTAADHITNWWLVPIEGLVYAGLESAIFYFLIKKFKWDIPGMKSLSDKLYSKDDFRNKGKSDERILSIIEGLGGEANLKVVDACATRLRVEVVDASLVNADQLKSLGAVAVVIKGTATQSIFGGEADVIKTKINNYLESKEDKNRKVVMA